MESSDDDESNELRNVAVEIVSGVQSIRDIRSQTQEVCNIDKTMTFLSKIETDEQDELRFGITPEVYG